MLGVQRANMTLCETERSVETRAVRGGPGHLTKKFPSGATGNWMIRRPSLGTQEVKFLRQMR